MFAFRHKNVAGLLAAAAIALPVASGLAQPSGAPAAAPGPAAQAPAGARGGAGRGAASPFDVPGANRDYNVSLRSDADKALPHPYARDETWFTMPPGRTLGSTSAIDIDKDGKSVWIAERCGGQDLCAGSHVAPVMKFDAKGNFVRAFGADMISYPHGIYVDRDGNVWVTDLQSNIDNAARGGRGGPPGASSGGPVTPAGAQVLKFSPEGKLLMRLGTPGVYGNDETHFSQPSDVVTAPNGDIFVADGHDSAPSNARIVKFDKNGKFIKAWGACGKNPINLLDCQHALAMDSQGRLFVGNRGNNRIEIFDQEGNLLDEWSQFGKPSGLFIDKNDTLYVADSESGVAQTNAYIRGVHVGSAKTGAVTAYIQDPLGNPAPWNPLRGTTGPEGVAADKDGVIYVSQVTPPGLARYTLKKPGMP
jgi:sugar lactone lactonase YvrE